MNNAKTTLNAAQKALDEARNDQTAAAAKLGTTNPETAAVQDGHKDHPPRVNATGHALHEAPAELQPADDHTDNPEQRV
ncbi:hypothetical protein, partial [Limosilactobacillus reuteri]|uniref:hypothetical protein n=1 Tax=Limosilactobacillus reuteri TaxID=1598 RepID=UPI000BD97F74